MSKLGFAFKTELTNKRNRRENYDAECELQLEVLFQSKSHRTFARFN